MEELNRFPDNGHIYWIDNVKLLACILVFTGHMLMGLTPSGILRETPLYWWFIDYIYSFHVALFFVMSGMLYQMTFKAHSFKDRLKYKLKKLVVLGIPYFTFILINWLIKFILADSVNNQVGSLIQEMFISPMAPYWYLYCLFFIFAVCPAVANDRQLAVLVVISIILKSVSIFWNSGIYVLDKMSGNLFWFSLGMLVSIKNKKVKRILKSAWIPLSVISIVCSYIHAQVIGSGWLYWLEGIATVFVIVHLFSVHIDKRIRASAYTMPVFLMHTMCAAGIRIVLLKIGIANPIIHVTLGLVASCFGPAVIYKIMEKIPYADFIIYPGRYIKN